MEQLGEGRRRVTWVVAEEAPRRRVERGDEAAGIRREHAVGHGLDQCRRLLPLPLELREAAVQLLMHRAQSNDVLGDLGHARVGEHGRASLGDRPCGLRELDERLRDLAGEEPGEHGGAQESSEPRQRHGALHGVDSAVHVREGRGHPNGSEAFRPAPDGDVELSLIGGRAQARGAPDARIPRRPDFRTPGVVLESGERVGVEVRVAADPARAVHQRHPPADQPAELAGRSRPAQRIGGQEGCDQACLALEPARDLVFQVTAEQLIGGEDEPPHRDRDEKAHGHEQASG